MHEHLYKIELLSDVSITADSATTGGHNALDYIPGAAFLGAAVQAANAAGEGFKPDLFLSGKVRFSDALPSVNGAISFPVPLSFHHKKGESWKGAVPVSPVNSREQLVQMRSGYLNASGEVLEPESSFRVKTAVDREKRRASDRKLYSCGAIPAGTVCHMLVQSESVDELKKIAGWFNGKELRVGRSRSAEFGRVRLTLTQERTETAEAVAAEEVSFFLLSDLALENMGQPTLLPVPEHFGLAGGELVQEKTFLRSRRYSTWNSFFSSRMQERQVLCKGGVITFSGKFMVKPVLSAGLYAEEGLGRVMANPAWLLKPPQLKCWEPGEKVGAKNPQTPLVAYLAGKSEDQKNSSEAFVAGLSWAKDLHALSRRIEAGYKVPGKSQWGAVRGIAASCLRSPELLSGKLNAYCGTALRKKAWLDAKPAHGRSLLEELRHKLGNNPDADACRKLLYASAEMRSLLGRKF